MRKAKDKPKDQLTEKEEQLMQLLWKHGPILVSKLIEYYPDPKPHFNTVSTVMRRLESRGIVGHNEVGGNYEYYAIAKMEDFRRRNFVNLIKDYFGGSYFGAVSALVQEEKITADELRCLLDLIESKGDNHK